MKKLWQNLQKTVIDNFLAEEFRLLATIPFLFALGIGIYFSLPFEPSIWLSLGIFELWLLIFYLCRYKNMHYFFIGGLIILSGFLNIQAHTIYQKQYTEKIPMQRLTYLRGQIKDISLSGKGKIRLLLHNASDYDNQLKGNFRITLNSQNPEISVGKCVETAATLFPNRRLPVLNGFKLDRKYFYDGLSATGYANSEVFIIDCPPQSSTDFISSINKIRQQIIGYIGRILPNGQAGVADALLVGEKTHIPPQITDNYRNSGLAHFLSVSGLHLGAIAALVFFMVRFLISLFPFWALRVDSKKIAALIAVLFSGLYLLVSGIAIPAQRAFIMTTVVLIGIIFNRQAISMRMVNFAALVILIIKPQTLISVSFQMSFAAVYALVAFYETYAGKLSRFAPRHNVLLKILWYLCNLVLADFIASMATLPFSLYHFHRAAVYTSLGNLSAGPIIAFWIMPAVLLCLMTLPFHLAYYPLKILGNGIAIINNITDCVSNLPHSIWHESIPFYGLILIICGAYWLCIWQQSWRRWGILPVIIGALSIFQPQPAPDMVFSDNLTDIAVRDSNRNMVWLPYKRNTWVQNIWEENLNVADMGKKQQKQFKQSLNGSELQKIDDIDLKCSDKGCIYKDMIEFTPRISLKIKGVTNNISSGGYIYLNEKINLQFFDDYRNCRPWQSCYKY
ncbi:MAG: ComEC/Rec2 family competence protein [Alphaproteobacteria bacterium]|nr:ComEC/Rec2 family competence protein [Alphaproteobacteria bacterium]